MLGGLILLLLSGNFLVRGAVALAHRLNMSTLVVGVVVVSFGTSVPELIVSIDAAVQGHPDISIGNVIGSNISNIALVLGLTALILPIPVNKTSIRFDWPVMMFASALLYVFVLNNFLELWEGILFVAVLSIFIFWSLKKPSGGSVSVSLAPEKNKEIPLWAALIFIIISSAGLLFGAEWLIKGTIAIARTIGVSERVISVSFVALGTSLPELATSVIAAVKKETDISVGNIIGSNIFNIFAILGITAIVREIKIADEILDFDIFWMLGISVLLLIFMVPSKTAVIKRWEGMVFVSIYIIYIYFVFTMKNTAELI